MNDNKNEALNLAERPGELNLTPIPRAHIRLNGLSVAPDVEFFLQISFNNGGIISPSLMIYNEEEREDVTIPLTEHFESRILLRFLYALKNYANQPLPDGLGAYFAKEISDTLSLEIGYEEHAPESVIISIDGPGLFAEEVVMPDELTPFININGGQN